MPSLRAQRTLLACRRGILQREARAPGGLVVVQLTSTMGGRMRRGPLFIPSVVHGEYRVRAIRNRIYHRPVAETVRGSLVDFSRLLFGGGAFVVVGGMCLAETLRHRCQFLQEVLGGLESSGSKRELGGATQPAWERDRIPCVRGRSGNLMGDEAQLPAGEGGLYCRQALARFWLLLATASGR